MPKFIPSNHVYPISEAAAQTVHFSQTNSNVLARGLRFPIPELAKNYPVPPMLPGQLVSVIAQTSNGKSMFMEFWERDACKQLAEEKRDEVIIHISVEDMIEEIIANRIATEYGFEAWEIISGRVSDFDGLKIAATKIAGRPLFLIGASLAHAEDNPNLHMSNVARCIDAIASGEITGRKEKIAAIFDDYLQAHPLDPDALKNLAEGTRRMQVWQDVNRLRAAAAKYACPVIIAVQAKRNLDGEPAKGFHLPGMYDGEETAFIGQRSDRIFTLWIPAKNYPPNSTVKTVSQFWTVTLDLCFLRVAKQRGKLPAGAFWPMKVDFARNEYTLLDQKKASLI